MAHGNVNGLCRRPLSPAPHGRGHKPRRTGALSIHISPPSGALIRHWRCKRCGPFPGNRCPPPDVPRSVKSARPRPGNGVLHLADNIKNLRIRKAVSLRSYLIMDFSWGNQKSFILHRLTDHGAMVFVFFRTKWVAVLSTDSMNRCQPVRYKLGHLAHGFPSMNTVKS